MTTSGSSSSCPGNLMSSTSRSFQSNSSLSSSMICSAAAAASSAFFASASASMRFSYTPLSTISITSIMTVIVSSIMIIPIIIVITILLLRAAFNLHFKLFCSGFSGKLRSLFCLGPSCFSHFNWRCKQKAHQASSLKHQCTTSIAQNYCSKARVNHEERL